jgi:hypothetical protein
VHEGGEAQREMECYLRSLRRVAEAVGHAPAVAEYQEISKALAAEGDDIEPFLRLYKYFGKSWERAQEALALSSETTTKAMKCASRIGGWASRQVFRGRTALGAGAGLRRLGSARPRPLGHDLRER